MLSHLQAILVHQLSDLFSSSDPKNEYLCKLIKNQDND